MSRLTIAQARLRMDDPHNCTDMNDVLTVLEAIYDALVRRDPVAGYAPALATSWEVSDDASIWLFHLRENVQFHDGTPLTAEAVIACLARMARPDMGVTLGAPGVYAQYLAGAIFEAPTGMSVRISLAEPLADLLDLLVYGYIAAPSCLENPIKTPIGTGPYVFEHADATAIQVSANPDHYDGHPAHDAITWLKIASAAGRLTALAEGHADVANTLPFEAEAPGARTGTYLSPTAVIYLFNSARGPLKDRRIRRALNLAIDRQRLIADVLDGAGASLHGLSSSAHMGYVPGDHFAHNHDEARALLDDAGVADGLTLDVDYPTSLPDEAEALTEAVAGQLASLNVHLRIRRHENREAYAHMVRLSEIGDMCVFDSSPLSTFRILYEKIDSRVGGSWWQGYSNTKVEALIDRARRTPDSAARAAIFRDCNRLLTEDPPWLFLYNHRCTIGLRGNHPDWAMRRDGVLDVRALPRNLGGTYGKNGQGVYAR